MASRYCGPPSSECVTLPSRSRAAARMRSSAARRSSSARRRRTRPRAFAVTSAARRTNAMIRRIVIQSGIGRRCSTLKPRAWSPKTSDRRCVTPSERLAPEHRRDQHNRKQDASDEADAPQRLSPQGVKVGRSSFAFGASCRAHLPELPRSRVIETGLSAISVRRTVRHEPG